MKPKKTDNLAEFVAWVMFGVNATILIMGIGAVLVTGSWYAMFIVFVSMGLLLWLTGRVMRLSITRWIARQAARGQPAPAQPAADDQAKTDES